MKLTTDLNSYFEETTELTDQEIKKLSHIERVEEMRKIIFNFEYGIDDEYKESFERGFIASFMFREIGFSTFTRWHFQLQNNLMINALRYNNLYKAELKDIEKAINNVHMTTESTGETLQDANTKGKGTTGGTTENFTENAMSDTPQGRLEIDGNYVSGLSEAKQIGKSDGVSEEENTQTVKGSATNQSVTKGYSGLTLTQLNRIFAEQMVVANELIFFNFEELFLQIVL